MHPAKRTLAIVALTTSLMSCSVRMVPASTPTVPMTTLRVYATTATLPLVNDFALSYSESHPLHSFETRSGNYQSMLDRLMAGEVTYFLSNHLPSDSPLWAAPLGQDGIAIIVHPTLMLDGLTITQLRDIYLGKISQWTMLGGGEIPITVITREEGSGTRAEFERLVMGRRPTSPNAQIVPSSASMVEAVQALPGSIGYVSMSYLDGHIKPLGVDGVLPTREMVSANRYPLRTTLYVVGQVPPEDEYLALISWMQGIEGQAILNRHHAPLLSITP